MCACVRVCVMCVCVCMCVHACVYCVMWCPHSLFEEHAKLLFRLVWLKVGHKEGGAREGSITVLRHTERPTWTLHTSREKRGRMREGGRDRGRPME